MALGFRVEANHRQFNAFFIAVSRYASTGNMHYFSSPGRRRPPASTGSTRSMPSGLPDGMLKPDASGRRLFGGKHERRGEAAPQLGRRRGERVFRDSGALREALPGSPRPARVA